MRLFKLSSSLLFWTTYNGFWFNKTTDKLKCCGLTAIIQKLIKYSVSILFGKDAYIQCVTWKLERRKVCIHLQIRKLKRMFNDVRRLCWQDLVKQFIDFYFISNFFLFGGLTISFLLCHEWLCNLSKIANFYRNRPRLWICV